MTTSPPLQPGNLAPPVGPAHPATEPDDRAPAIVASALRAALNWFTAGNLIVRLGALIFLAGVVFLLRLAAHYFVIPAWVWLLLVTAGGLIMTGLGYRLARHRRGYGLTLQGLGLAIGYLSLFAAFRRFDLLDGRLTFILLTLLSALTAGLSSRQNALPLALLAFGGAFISPLLTAGETGSLSQLFSYYLVVNLGLAWLAHRHTWKLLNLTGLLATFGLGLWLGQTPAQQVQIDQQRLALELLLLAHVALYLFITVRFSQQINQLQHTMAARQLAGIPVVDSSLLFGLPLLTLPIQAVLLQPYEYGLAIYAGLLALIYLLLGRWLRRSDGAVRLLAEGSAGLGLAFSAMVWPLAVAPYVTVSGWLLQGAALVWLGLRQGRGWQVVMGILLQVMGTLLLPWMLSETLDQQQWQRYLWSGMLSLATGWLATAWLLFRQKRREPQPSNWNAILQLPGTLALWLGVASGSYWLNGLYQQSMLPAHWQLMPVLHTGIVVLVLLAGLAVYWRWPQLRQLGRVYGYALLLLALMAGLTWTPWTAGRQLTVGAVWLAAALVLAYWHRQDHGVTARQTGWTAQAGNGLGLAILWWLGLLLLSSRWLDQLWPGLSPVSLVWLPMILLYWLQQGQAVPRWLHRESLQRYTGLISAAGLGIWLVGVNLAHSGQLPGMPYLPVISLLDLTLLGILWLLYRQRQQAAAPDQTISIVLIGLLGWWTLTGMTVRAMHHWQGTPLWLQGAWHDDQVQIALTLVWSVVALMLTLMASRRGWRLAWLAGIGLLGLTGIKLLLVDLSAINAIYRVISFMGMGLVMLIMGYLAPLPPARSIPSSGMGDRHNLP